jgi:hypothetical protein
MISAPPDTNAFMSGTVKPGLGSPAVMNGMSALRPFEESVAKDD